MGMMNPVIDFLDERLARQDDPVRKTVEFIPGASAVFPGASNDIESLLHHVRKATSDRARFFTAPVPLQFSEADDLIRWDVPDGVGYRCPGPVVLPKFQAKTRGDAVIVVPHMSSTETDYTTLCRIFRRRGLTAVRYILPFHKGRGLTIGHGSWRMVNADLGATIASIRQAVIEVMSLAAYLKQSGYKSVRVVGFSVGSCVSTISAALSNDIDRVSLNLMADNFANVVWSGRATWHIRKVVEQHMTLDQLSEAWDLLHPKSYADHLAARGIPVQMTTAEYDKVMPRKYALSVGEAFEGADVKLDWRRYRCGHYTIAWPPFSLVLLRRLLKFMDQPSAKASSH
ncbi:MAG: hypothetical protein R3287_04465 [Anderseniella sp.]|nr:hypothetical protein [Anderseniella sp.]